MLGLHYMDYFGEGEKKAVKHDGMLSRSLVVVVVEVVVLIGVDEFSLWPGSRCKLS